MTGAERVTGRELLVEYTTSLYDAVDRMQRFLDDPATVLAEVRRQWDASEQIVAEAKADLRSKSEPSVLTLRLLAGDGEGEIRHTRADFSGSSVPLRVVQGGAR